MEIRHLRAIGVWGHQQETAIGQSPAEWNRVPIWLLWQEPCEPFHKRYPL